MLTCVCLWIRAPTGDAALQLVYVGALVHGAHADELFLVAHALVEGSGGALAWYAVGGYYLLTGRHDAARHYYRRALLLQPHMAECWVGCAHAFALQGEHDQAMAAYRSAARLVRTNGWVIWFCASHTGAIV